MTKDELRRLTEDHVRSLRDPQKSKLRVEHLKYLQPLDIPLTEEEAQLGLDIGALRQSESVKMGSPNRHAMERRPNVSEEENHQASGGLEVSTAKVFNSTVEKVVRGYGFNDVDTYLKDNSNALVDFMRRLPAGLNKLECKWRNSDWEDADTWLIVRDLNDADKRGGTKRDWIYILGKGGPDKFRIIGWIHGRDIREEWWCTPNKKTAPGYVIPIEYLHPIRFLLDAREDEYK